MEPLRESSDQSAIEIVTSPEARSFIRERGGLLFVWISNHRGLRGHLSLLRTTTELPPGALDYERLEAKGFLVFLHPRMVRRPRSLHLEVRGRFRRRLEAYWDGCAFVI